MRKTIFLFLAICLLTECFSVAQESSSDNWLENWINAVELAKDRQNYPKAIENYTASIQTLDPNPSAILFILLNERGNLYLKSLDFDHAIKDFYFVLNHSESNREQKIEALWGRSKAHIGMGKIREFQNDCEQLEQLEAFATTIEENKNFAIFKLASYILRDPKSQEIFSNLLLAQKEIQTKKDVTFTPSGLVIIRKNSSQERKESELSFQQ